MPKRFSRRRAYSSGPCGDPQDAYDVERSWLDGQSRAMKEHEANSGWVFGELFRYAKGMRGGLAFICVHPKSSAKAIGTAIQWVVAALVVLYPTRHFFGDDPFGLGIVAYQR